MKDPQQKELEQMALSAELARQVVHDCRNFLYNLLLQFEISEKVSHEDASNWTGIKKEAKRLANRLQEWHQHGLAVSPEKQKIDLNGLLRDLRAELPPECKWVHRLSPGPLWLVSFPNEVKCLCCFLLQTAAGSGSAADSALSIQTGKKAETAVLRIGGVQNVGNALGGPDGSPSDNSETGRSTLLLDACKSIAVRLDARIHVENEPNRPAALVVEFPLELS